jgi:hypothetical protein
MNMVSLLDDSPGEEIAVLIMILAATATVAAPQQKAQPSCPAERILVAYDPVPMIAPFGWSQAAKDQALLVSKILEPQKTEPKYEILPRSEPAPSGPSVLTPACKTEQRKKKDYPMA